MTTIHNFPKKIWAIILAAGQGSRLAHITKTKKQFIEYLGKPLYWNSAKTLANHPNIQGLVIVFPPEDLETAIKNAHEQNINNFPVPILFSPGGTLRQDSVFNALQILPKNAQYVLIHDGARPFVSLPLITKLIENFSPDIQAVIPTLALKDTIKQTKNNIVDQTLPRELLVAVQTPQFFAVNTLLKAHQICAQENYKVTDDASMVEKIGGIVKIIEGEENNIKITTEKDLLALENKPQIENIPCVGYGYDVHRFGGTRPCILGGIPISKTLLIDAHSDGDVLIHALCDAILGCLGLGDIGDFFPDTDSKFDNISGGILLSEVLHKAMQSNFKIAHVDLTIITQTPKISPYKDAIRKNLAALLNLTPNHVNIKATTEEKLGFTGRKEGIKSVAVVTGWLRGNL